MEAKLTEHVQDQVVVHIGAAMRPRHLDQLPCGCQARLREQGKVTTQ